MNFTIKPVGFVRNGVKERSGMGLGGAPSVVEILPAYRKALDQLDGQSHVWVLGYLHRADRSVLRARPRKVSASLGLRGVFALRSPDRPNPLALSCARLLKVHGRRLYLDALDMIDGTPVADIKPYSVGIDCVPAAVQPDYSRKYALLSDEQLGVTLGRVLKNNFLCLKKAHKMAGALVFKYIRVSGCAPSPSAGRLSLRGAHETALAVGALFGSDCVCHDRLASTRLVVAGKRLVSVSCSEKEVRAFAALAKL